LGGGIGNVQQACDALHTTSASDADRRFGMTDQVGWDAVFTDIHDSAVRGSRVNGHTRDVGVVVVNRVFLKRHHVRRALKIISADAERNRRDNAPRQARMLPDKKRH